MADLTHADPTVLALAGTVLVTSLLSGRDGLYGFRFASGTYRCDTIANVA